VLVDESASLEEAEELSYEVSDKVLGSLEVELATASRGWESVNRERTLSVLLNCAVEVPRASGLEIEPEDAAITDLAEVNS
jgi:hypothetical protein